MTGSGATRSGSAWSTRPSLPARRDAAIGSGSAHPSSGAPAATVRVVEHDSLGDRPTPALVEGDLVVPAVRGETPAPLATDEWARADRIARRLHAEIVALLATLPPDARNASGLARHLGVDRTTCQRAVFAVARPYLDPTVLTRLPGTKALRELAEAAGRSLGDDGATSGLVAAIDQFQEFIHAVAGSQSRLARRIDATGQAPSSAPPELSDREVAAHHARVRLFDAASELTGRSSGCWVAIYAYRPLPGSPDLLEVCRAHGLARHVARPDAVPLTLHNFTTKPSGGAPTPGHFEALGNGNGGDGRSLESLLDEFTSDPPPLVRSRQPNEFLVQSIDEREAAIGRPVDFMLATRTTMPHPARQTPPIEEAWALVNFPCRHLLFDIYLHRDLARRCIPSLDTHLWRPDFAQHVGDRWQTRFADSPPLQLLGAGIRTTATPAYPRMTELTRALFTRAGLEPREFVGFRCEIAYPIWRAGYCVSFDFSAEGDPSSMSSV